MHLSKLRALWHRLASRYINRETISYLIFGVLTTILNFLIYMFCRKILYMESVVSNTLAWILAVLFAFVVNKRFVFQSHVKSLRGVLREWHAFVACRLLSLLFENVFIWLTVDQLHWGDAVSKILAGIVVVIMNYIASKWFIFAGKQKKASSEEEDGKRSEGRNE